MDTKKLKEAVKQGKKLLSMYIKELENGQWICPDGKTDCDLLYQDCNECYVKAILSLISPPMDREAVLAIMEKHYNYAVGISGHNPKWMEELDSIDATEQILALSPPMEVLNCEKCKVMLSAMSVHPKTVEPKVLSDEEISHVAEATAKKHEDDEMSDMEWELVLCIAISKATIEEVNHAEV